jgi:hypothetical protein
MMNFKDLELIGESDFSLHQNFQTGSGANLTYLLCRGHLDFFSGQSGWGVILTV